MQIFSVVHLIRTRKSKQLSQLHIVKTGRNALFVAAGFARVTIKELLLSGVPHRTHLVK